MPNSLHKAGADGVALQVTTEARSAGLIEEDTDGDPTRRADVLVHVFDELVLVFDRDTDRVPMADRAAIVAAAARETDSTHRAQYASIQTSGNGYRVQIPGAGDAGFSEGDSLPCHAAPGMLLIAPFDASVAQRDLLGLRTAQAVDG